jgi:predicted Zn-dependent protease
MRGLFAMLQRDAQMRGVGRLPTWQATHPDPGDRLRTVDQLVDASPANFSTLRVGAAPYLKEIDGLVYGEDPRAGYFQGSLFVHPDLAFVLRFPEGWALQNAPQSVTAVAPEGDAVLELRGAPGSLNDAAQGFVNQEGLTASPLQSLQIHGLDALRATFVTQADGESAVQGVVTFLRFADATWRIVGFAVPARYAAVSAEFDRSTASFARLVDPVALAVQPRRISIVTVPRSMSFGEFATQYPSSVPLEELAIVNGLSSTAALSAGQLLKRIVGNRPPQTAQQR